MSAQVKFPIGIQTFENIRREGFLYVDKTALIHKLVHEGKVYFLSRPRRFGKSLLVTTLKSFFEGRADLFRGLAIESLESEWTHYPVLHFDFSLAKNKDLRTLREVIHFQLKNFEKIYGLQAETDVPSIRLASLIRAAEEKSGQKVVVLVDEYDAPLLDTMAGGESFEAMRNLMRDFYSPLKACDANLRFVFLTGITKFSQLSIFSELNNLKNISMMPEFSTVCGITESELSQMTSEVEALALSRGISKDTARALLKSHYDGYHFSAESPDVYNPFSLLSALAERNIGDFWFSTGTPTLLTQTVSRYAIDPEDFEKGFAASADMFDVPTETATDPIPILYQSGYLTIKNYDAKAFAPYRLAYPNEEVRNGFVRCLLKNYSGQGAKAYSTTISSIIEGFRSGDIDSVMIALRAYMSGVPYDAEPQTELHYKSLVYCVFSLATPYFVRCEEKSAAGRNDVIVETDDAVYVLEFKLDGSAEEALRQIENKGYLLPYSAAKKSDGTPKRLVKIGVGFDREKRTIGNWMTGNFCA